MRSIHSKNYFLYLVSTLTNNRYYVWTFLGARFARYCSHMEWCGFFGLCWTFTALDPDSIMKESGGDQVPGIKSRWTGVSPIAFLSWLSTAQYGLTGGGDTRFVQPVKSGQVGPTKSNGSFTILQTAVDSPYFGEAGGLTKTTVLCRIVIDFF